MVKKRVLIVEDDHKSLYALTAVLEQHGYQVAGFSNPAAADTDAQSIDCAIIDLRLPDIPGAQFAARLRERNPAIKIVFVTAYAADDGVSMEGIPLLVKPLNVRELLEHL